jgi:nitroreductase
MYFGDLLIAILSKKRSIITHCPFTGINMEFIDVVKSRSSVRTYDSIEVEDDKINYVLECARLAPSWVNKQCWSFVVVKDKKTIKILSKTTIINRWLRKVPCIIVACGDPKLSGTHNGIEYFTVDVAIAMEHLILAATDMGLSSCWIGGFNEKKVKEALGIPKRIRVVALTPLGYLAKKRRILGGIIKIITRSKKRRSLDEIIHYDKW